jgi:hypothetical protein
MPSTATSNTAVTVALSSRPRTHKLGSRNAPTRKSSYDDEVEFLELQRAHHYEGLKAIRECCMPQVDGIYIDGLEFEINHLQKQIDKLKALKEEELIREEWVVVRNMEKEKSKCCVM